MDARFASEKMEGNNQYHCRTCGLQDATLTYSLKSTPPTLCVQLCRFTFDRVRQKVSDCIRFPEQLCLDKYLVQTGQTSAGKASSTEANYELVSVLIHMGHSSTSGHFIDCIKEYGEDAESSSDPSWYTFNDADVQGPFKKLDLKSAEQQTKSKGKIPSGYHASSNAYILWYKRRDEAFDAAPASTPSSVPASASSSSSTLSTRSATSIGSFATSIGSLASSAFSNATTNTTVTNASSTNSLISASSTGSTIAYLESSLESPLSWPPQVPLEIRQAVEADNQGFVATFKQSEEAMVHAAHRGKERQDYVQKTHQEMWLDQDDSVGREILLLFLVFSVGFCVSKFLCDRRVTR